MSDAATQSKALPPPAERGFTDVSPTVAEKIAQRAASEVDGVGGVSATGLGRLFGSSKEVGAAAAMGTDRTSLELSLSVYYPRPVKQVTDEVRRKVVNRVQELSGLAVGDVDITVAELPAQSRRSRRRVA